MICIAPMMGHTDRHFRYLMRLFSPALRLYTEMISTQAILHGNHARLLAYSMEEHPLALQLGGNDPDRLARCAKIAEAMGYDEINLNAGCPSKRAQDGNFGACLMASPECLGECVSAVREAVSIPVTVKCRTGLDTDNDAEFLYRFVQTLSSHGCTTFIIHARNAWLKGLSPAKNRHIPPLRYELVYRIQRDFPKLKIIINGGIRTCEDIRRHLPHVQGVMIGRAAVDSPWFLFRATSGNNVSAGSRHEIVLRYLPYISAQLQQDVPMRIFCRHLMGIYHGVPGARQWRHTLCDATRTRDINMIRDASEQFPVDSMAPRYSG